MEKLTNCSQTVCPCNKKCPLKSVLEIIGGKWKMQILCIIELQKSIRYGELKRMVVGITPTMLAQSLHELEDDGMIIRKQYPVMPVRVEYSLTKMGESIIPLLTNLKKWGEDHIDYYINNQ